jgi:uncharacterized ion transporter superfamily protein YfcC
MSGSEPFIIRRVWYRWKSTMTSLSLRRAPSIRSRNVVTSGSAKALLVIPILMPLADLVNVNRQIAISAYCFGDGFSNLVYPTNALLLITLSLTVVPYHKWLKWVLRLWPWIILVTVLFLAGAVAINYGPF